MKIKIAKEFKWEMSHRLPFHKGLCKNIHGHTYKMRIEITGEPDENGMVMDYYDLAEIVLPVVNELDHSFLCDSNDNVMLDFLRENNFKHVIISKTTTAENIAEHIISQLGLKFKKFQNVEHITVRFFETEDVYSEMELKLK